MVFLIVKAQRRRPEEQAQEARSKFSRPDHFLMKEFFSISEDSNAAELRRSLMSKIQELSFFNSLFKKRMKLYRMMVKSGEAIIIADGSCCLGAPSRVKH
jgi:hypothetical protein